MFISSNCNISIFIDVSQFFTCSYEGLKKSRKVIQITKLKREFYLNFHWTLLLALGFVSLKESVCNESTIDAVNYMISIERVVKNVKKKKKNTAKKKKSFPYYSIPGNIYLFKVNNRNTRKDVKRYAQS